jgi:hypothetical protein
MSEPTDAGGYDDFAAGWLSAWKALLAAGVEVPDPVALDLPLPADLTARLRRGAVCLGRLHRLWPARRDGTAVPAGRTVGRFVVRREVGRGGFGIVYLADDPVLARPVAVKVPAAGAATAPAAAARLAAEAQAVARLGHPNIVPVYETGTAADVPYVVSAYCPGGSLADWLRQTTGPVPWRDAAAVVAAVARGIYHAHQRGVLHCDLKPANILLTDAGADGSSTARPLTDYVPRVTDFGLARVVAAGPPDSVSGTIRGTPAYMAPEQATGRPGDVTTAADVYALGAVWYELLTRRPPHDGGSPLATLDRVRAGPPARAKSVRPDLPADVDTVCQKCLNPEPGRRYASAADLAADLDRLLRGEPVLARPVGRVGRLRRAARRHPAVTGLAACLVITLVAGLVVTAGLLQRTRRERDRAQAHLVQSLLVSEESALTAVNDPLLREADARPIRARLAAAAAAQLERWLADCSDEPADRRLAARCHLQLAALYLDLGRPVESRAAADRAAAAFESVIRADPDDAGAAHGLAAAWLRQAYAEPDAGRRADLAARAVRAYEALPTTTCPPDRQARDLAGFEFDQAILARDGGDRAAVLRYLESAGRRLERAGVDRRFRSRVLCFRCQVERTGGDARSAVAAGETAFALAQAECGDRPDDYQALQDLAGAANEYGLALLAAGRRPEGRAVLRAGFERLGHPAVHRAAAGASGRVVRLAADRLTLAYNLGRDFARGGDRCEADRWFRTGAEIGGPVRFALPDDTDVARSYGLCRLELARAAPRPAERLASRAEGLNGLEATSAARPADQALRSDLGWQWHEHARDLQAVGAPTAALLAAVRGTGHQAMALVAVPGRPDWRLRFGLQVQTMVHLLPQAGLVIPSGPRGRFGPTGSAPPGD